MGSLRCMLESFFKEILSKNLLESTAIEELTFSYKVISETKEE